MKTISNSENYEPGASLITYVIFPETQEGTILLSVDRAKGEQGWKTLDVARQEGKTLIGKIIDSNKGGSPTALDLILRKMYSISKVARSSTFPFKLVQFLIIVFTALIISLSLFDSIAR